MPNFHIYKDSPTAGGTDGTLVSEGTGLSAIDFGILNATNNEVSDVITLAIRTDADYEFKNGADIIPKGYATTLSAEALVGATSITVTSVGEKGAGVYILRKGISIEITDGTHTESRVITSVSGNVVSFETGLTYGYASGSDVTSMSNLKVQLSKDNITWADYGAGISFTATIGATNTLFYAKAKATADETDPVNDHSILICASGVVSSTVA